MPLDPRRQQLLTIIEARADVAGRFVNIRRLGQEGGGGYTSFVFSADDKASNSRVALKVLDPYAEPYRRLCFEREAVSLEGLMGRPDIVQLIASRDTFVEHLTTAGGLPVDYAFDYFCLELADGSVEDVILAAKFDLLDRLRIFAAMCRAVQRVHVIPMAHRDLKPANFLRFSRGVIKVADFGTARPLGPGTGPIVPRYAAPPGDLRYTPVEMLASLHDREPEIAVCADFYALGAILFELLAGSPLALYLWDLAYAHDLIRVMGAVDPSQRRPVFERFVDVIADNHPLPSLRDVARHIPRGIVSELDGLYQGLAAIDYRKRLCGFDRVFRQIRICQIIAGNERIERMRIDRQRRRRLERQTRPTAKAQ